MSHLNVCLFTPTSCVSHCPLIPNVTSVHLSQVFLNHDCYHSIALNLDEWLSFDTKYCFTSPSALQRHVTDPTTVPLTGLRSGTKEKTAFCMLCFGSESLQQSNCQGNRGARLSIWCLNVQSATQSVAQYPRAPARCIGSIAFAIDDSVICLLFQPSHDPCLWLAVRKSRGGGQGIDITFCPFGYDCNWMHYVLEICMIRNESCRE
jgi:hypothetical protein